MRETDEIERDETAWIALGANLGDRAATIDRAVARIDALPESSIIATAPLYETAPIGPDGQAPYINSVVGLRTSLSSPELLTAFGTIEQELGRRRRARWHAREIDIDLILRGNEIIGTPQLTLPHPAFRSRRFVLVPLADVAAEQVDPVTGRTIAALLAALPSQKDDVRPFFPQEESCDT